MTDETILITGGTGFVGSHLVEELLSKGFTKIFVTNYGSTNSYVHSILPESQIISVNLTDQAETFHLIETLKPKWIFHLASIAIASNSFEKAATIFQNNIGLQLNLLEAVKVHSPQSRILVVGSGMEYGMIAHDESEPVDLEKYPGVNELTELKPTNPYAVSKITQDLLGLSYHYSYQLDVVRARPFNHIGERQTTDFAIPAFASQIAQIEKGQQEKILVGNLDAVRDFSDVKDIVKGYILLLEKGQSGEVYNLGGGRGYVMRNVLDMLCRMANVPITVEIDPARYRPVDVPIAVANIKKMKAIGWMPTIALEQTLQRVLNEWRTRSL